MAATLLEWMKWGIAVAALVFLLRLAGEFGSVMILRGLKLEGTTEAYQVLLLAVRRATLYLLCMTPILGNSFCQPYMRANHLFCSIRLRDSLDALVKKQIVCPYCNEITDFSYRPKSI
jgi:hypothetical protein